MKSFKIIIALTIIFSIFSCSISKKTAKNIIGKWQIVALKTDVSSVTDNSVNNIVNSMLKSSFIEFNQDKTFKLSVLNKPTIGTWSISEDGKRILTSNKDVFFEIQNISDNTMSLKSVKKETDVLLELKR